ncbi:hypothetical protein [Parasitella parasitica]|uniref:Uncharacterized protein n=1 Tax=Parasitella parasitica TaxID=35722 RepID=A0A0B7NFS3_9FUNG|nr:hypothetical protein [Parasitella parasitica]
METHVFIEDGQGRIFDDRGCGAMDLKEELDPYHLTSLTRIRECCSKRAHGGQPSDESLDEQMEEAIDRVKTRTKTYNVYTNDQKLRFVYYNRVKLSNAAKSGRLAGGIAERTAQKWAKKLKEDKDWNIFEKQTNKCKLGTSQLEDRHKDHLISLYDANPQARLDDAVESLAANFEGFNLKKTSVRNLLITDCTCRSKELHCGLFLETTQQKEQIELSGSMSGF